MVDFQSRDSGRGRADDGDEQTESEDEAHEHGTDHDTGGGDGQGANHRADHDHHHHHDVSQLGVAVVTVSSSRSLDDDPAGDAVVEALEADGNEVVQRELIRDKYDSIQGTVNTLVQRDDVDLVVTTGGTGITPDDVTIEAIEPLLDKELRGFGELFRTLSYDTIGSKAIATRATAGVVDDTLLFCLPGSEAAVRLGTEELILDQAGHLVGLASRTSND